MDSPDFYSIVAAALAAILVIDISILWLLGRTVPDLLSQLIFGLFGFYFGRAPGVAPRTHSQNRNQPPGPPPGPPPAPASPAPVTVLEERQVIERRLIDEPAPAPPSTTLQRRHVQPQPQP